MLQEPQTAEAISPVRPAGQATRAENSLAQVIVTSLLVVLAFGAGWFGNGFVNRANYVPPEDVNQHIVNQAWNEITRNFVFTGAIDKQKMAYAAINAMVDTLNDPGHTRFE